mgnify:CR=1 FL=1
MSRGRSKSVFDCRRCSGSVPVIFAHAVQPYAKRGKEISEVDGENDCDYLFSTVIHDLNDGHTLAKLADHILWSKCDGEYSRRALG